MAETLTLNKTSKQDTYQDLIPQIIALIQAENDAVANMANISAALKEAFNWWWVGFYRVKEDELVLGPFQGPIACTRIKIGKGVCGGSWQQNQTLLVPDVDAFPGHIACSSASRSEIVVPIRNKAGVVMAVLDVDSEHLNHFDLIDQRYLEELCQAISDTDLNLAIV